VVLAGQVGVAGHCTLGDGVVLTAQSGTSHDIPAGKVLSGSPAFETKGWLKSVAMFQRLPEIVKGMRKTVVSE
jgi:UDP-3-O-[3-hydroxymyristoyl] glucosamine N-acyltransferase